MRHKLAALSAESTELGVLRALHETALNVKLPLIRKWIGLMLIVAFATGTQLFTEPELTSQAARVVW